MALAEVAAAREHLEQGVALADPRQFPWGRIGSLSWLSVNLLWLGHGDQGVEKSQEALSLARKLPNRYMLAWALFAAAMCHVVRQEWRAAQERAEELMTLSTEQGFPQWASQGMILRGAALVEQGRVAEGMTQIQEGLIAYQAIGAASLWPYYLALLAGAYAKAGQTEEGLSTLAEAFTAVRTHGQRLFEPLLYWLKGALTLQRFQGPSCTFTTSESVEVEMRSLESEAEACFQKAIDIARRQSARVLELRAGMSLSRLWQRQGKTAEARTLLAEIYNWFTEGFDTVDVREARDLLDAWA